MNTEIDSALADPSNGHDFRPDEVLTGTFCERCHLPLKRWAGGPCPGSPGVFPPGVMR
ncbi:hypothetical protein ACFU98_29350 [Streptomyces sp. NPDC057575]|uniref:hypothetical protein n=1 Tax=unclassified Streptomyces TaxID=2593676 RepID=UPI0036C71B1B